MGGSYSNGMEDALIDQIGVATQRGCRMAIHWQTQRGMGLELDIRCLIGRGLLEEMG